MEFFLEIFLLIEKKSIFLPLELIECLLLLNYRFESEMDNFDF